MVANWDLFHIFKPGSTFKIQLIEYIEYIKKIHMIISMWKNILKNYKFFMIKNSQQIKNEGELPQLSNKHLLKFIAHFRLKG